MVNFSVTTCNPAASSREHVTPDLPSLEILSLADNLLTIAPNVSLMPKLVKLELHQNKFVTFPPAYFQSNIKLEKIILQRNEIQTPPDLQGACQRLERFDVSFNKISTLPPGYFKNCPKLNSVQFEYNLLTSALPFNEIGPSLGYLTLNHNDIPKILASEFKNLTNLRSIRAGVNPMDFFDASTLENKPSLIRLELNNNRLKSLDNLYNFCIGKTCKHLELILHGNPLVCDEKLCWTNHYKGHITVKSMDCPKSLLEQLNCPGKRLIF